MKTKILKTGMKFKNYKEMCELLEMEFKEGNSRKAQFKELMRYCSYEKSGHSIIIREVYPEPLEKENNYKGNNTIYGDIIQLLIVDLLAKSDGHLSIGRTKLMERIGMVNINYNECKIHSKKLAEFLNIDIKVIRDFYNTNSSNFRKIIETSLNKLMDKRIIMYNTVIKIKELNTYNYRDASKEELNTIALIERKTLSKMGYESISQIRMSKDWTKFKNTTNELLHSLSDIDYYFTAYDIVINEEYIIKERTTLIDLILDSQSRLDNKDKLNKLIVVNIEKNAIKRNESTTSEDTSYMSKTRRDWNYVKNINSVSDILVSSKSPRILHELLKPTEKDKLEKLIEDSLDGLF